MRRIRLRAPGKINWTLDVKGKRPDGYHEVEMLMQSIGLWDEIVLTERSAGIQISGNDGNMPLDESNLAAKAARLIMDHFNITSGIQIEIQKNIPIAAGLAGGSTDAAAVLVGLNALWGLGLSCSMLEEMGTSLGADVPFCIRGGTAAARGIGEKLTSLPPIKGIRLVLVKPGFGVSTQSIYRELDAGRIEFHPDWKKVYDLLAAGNFAGLGQNMYNVLESITKKHHPEIDDIREQLLSSGAAVSMMTGSGPAVYGVFGNASAAKQAAKEINRSYPQVYLVSSHDRGVEITEGGSL